MSKTPKKDTTKPEAKPKQEPEITDTQGLPANVEEELVLLVPHPPTEQPETPKQPTPRTRYTWIIDPGHGPRTPGRRSPKLADGGRYYEWQFNQNVAVELLDLCTKAGIDAKITLPHVTRRGDDLIQRVRLANETRHKYPPIFASIHTNASPTPNENTWGKASGTETWHFHGSERGKEIATVFQRHLVAATALRDRGVKSKEAQQFYVLRATHMPAILTEAGFHNHPEDVAFLNNPEGMKDVAWAHFAAICEVEGFNELPG